MIEFIGGGGLFLALIALLLLIMGKHDHRAWVMLGFFGLLGAAISFGGVFIWLAGAAMLAMTIGVVLGAGRGARGGNDRSGFEE